MQKPLNNNQQSIQNNTKPSKHQEVARLFTQMTPKQIESLKAVGSVESMSEKEKPETRNNDEPPITISSMGCALWGLDTAQNGSPNQSNFYKLLIPLAVPSRGGCYQT